MRILVAIIAAAIAVACSSETETTTTTPTNGSGCTDITGNYSVTVTQLSGTCAGGGQNPITLTIASVNGALNVAIPGVDGGCPADLNASTCRLSALCKITATNGALAATLNVDYTFTGTTFTGTLAGSLEPPISDPACQETVRHDGKRI